MWPESGLSNFFSKIQDVVDDLIAESGLDVIANIQEIDAIEHHVTLKGKNIVHGDIYDNNTKMLQLMQEIGYRTAEIERESNYSAKITISFSGDYLDKSSVPEHSVGIKYSVNIPPRDNP